MENFIVKLRVLAELVIAVICGYVALTYAFSTLLPRLVLAVIALYIFSQALGYIDDLNGYNQDDDDNDKEENSTQTGIPDNLNENAGNPVIQDDDAGNPEITFILDKSPEDIFPDDDTL